MCIINVIIHVNVYADKAFKKICTTNNSQLRSLLLFFLKRLNERHQ